MKVLVTGFDPFGGESINPAWAIAQKLAILKIEGVTVIAKQLPTVYGKSIEVAISAIELNQPDLVIALGQAGGRSDISIERVAINIDDAPISDNQDNKPVDIPIVEGGPAAYFSTLPIKKMVEEIRRSKIPASISNTAGTFVCNHLMYGILHYIAKNDLKISAGFIHVPYLPEQAVHHKSAPSMSFSNLETALKIAIKVAVAERVATWKSF